ncbi:hypothetical protein N0V93_003337 [Gnomoniopsis smithogilvyi]|uniref:PCI domain-containing protein n=1 Tax=Gnomoniopsis smithogilvyi TaxID=1191159 RepID=A0A9W9CYI3_9PEZI|nr:hypothetical protein N0V93_003337 [Gnomoniopsis smithogilvyi]
MEQTKALNALEPFLALTKSATSSRAAADLIDRATKAPGTYIFTSLLNSAPIAALANSQNSTDRAWHTHLTIFSHGLYSTYLTYPRLLAHLGLTSARELEDVVISAVYAGVLTARLNPARQEVQVSSVAPLRDVPPPTIPSLVAVLQQWSARCDATLAELERNMATIRAEAATALERKREAESSVEAAVEAEEMEISGAGGGGGGSGSITARAVRAARGRATARGASKRGMMEVDADEEEEDDEAMDLDEDGGEGKQKLARRRKL